MLNARSLLIVPALLALFAVTAQTSADGGPLFELEYFAPETIVPGSLVSLSPSVTYTGTEVVEDLRVQLFFPPFLEPLGNSDCELLGRRYECTFDGLSPPNSQQLFILDFLVDFEVPCNWTLRSPARLRSSQFEDEAFSPERATAQFTVDCDGGQGDEGGGESSSSSAESSDESSSSSEASSEESSSSSEEGSASSVESGDESSSSSSEASEESSSSSAESSDESSSSSSAGSETGGGIPTLPNTPLPQIPGLHLPSVPLEFPSFLLGR